MISKSVFNIVFIYLAILTGCDHKKKTDVQQSDFNLSDQATLDRQAWVEKTVRLLRAGQGPKSLDELQQLNLMSNDQLIDKLMSEDSFGNVALDFSLFFLGFKDDRLKLPNSKDPASFFSSTFMMQHTAAMEGARRILSGDDFLGFLTWDLPVAIEPMAPIYDEATNSFDVKHSTERRKTKIAELHESFERIVSKYSDSSPIPKEEFCKEVVMFESNSLLNNLTNSFGFSRSVLTFFDRDPAVQEFETKILFGSCLKNTGSLPLPEGTLDVFRRYKNYILGRVDHLMQYDWDHYVPDSFSKIQFQTRSVTDHAQNPTRYSNHWQWMFLNFLSPLPNSSTNYSRKRASYVLKRFFCDDLTPINLQATDDHHPENRHASDPNCQSCHYKLDPMAGFFRYLDGFGRVTEKDKNMFFSDNARKPMSEYLVNWQRIDGKRPWNVGYIRSATDESLNDYSDHPNDPQFEDLLAIIQKSKESRTCVVRRAFEYFVADHQAVDPLYIESLTDTYVNASKDKSQHAFKALIKSLVQSKTYSAKNPDPEQCFDYPEGINPADRPPCRVAALLERNCASCHKGEGAAGGLDLMSWIDVDSGRKSFSHKDQDRNQITPGKTYQVLLERMSSSDVDKRMPLNKQISTADRDALYLWFNERLLTFGGGK